MSAANRAHLPASELTDPDAPLFAAWEQWRGAMRGYYSGKLSEHEYEKAHQRADDDLTCLPAHTVAGTVVKLKLAFHDLCEMRSVDSAVFVYSGEPPADVLTGDCCRRLMWEAITTLEQMTGRA